MFNHLEVSPLDVLPKESINGKRFYVTPQGNKYASVTTILAGHKNKALDTWKEQVGEQEYKKVIKRAGLRGTDLHLMVEHYLNNDLNIKRFDPISKFNFKTIKPMLDDHVSDIMYQESTLYSDTLKSAGTVDLIAHWDGKLRICDFKSKNLFRGYGTYKDYYMQMSAYSQMFYEMKGIRIEEGVIIYAIEGGDAEHEVITLEPWIAKFKALSDKFYANLDFIIE